MTGLLFAIGGFIEALIGLRFVFRLLGANPAASFVNWVYDWSTPLVSPFAGIFGQNATVVNGAGTVTTSVFDWTALIALVVYGLILAAISSMFTHRRATY